MQRLNLRGSFPVRLPAPPLPSRPRDGNSVPWTGQHSIYNHRDVSHVPRSSGCKDGVEYLMDVIQKEHLTVRFGLAVQRQLRADWGTFPAFKSLYKAKFWQDGH